MHQAGSLECGVQLVRSLLRCPSELEPREGILELCKIRLVGALIRAGLGYSRELAARDRFRDDLADLADLVIELVRTGVKGLVVDKLQWRLEHRLERARYVLDMDHRSPRRAVAVEHDAPSGEGAAHQIVENRVEAHARR